MRETLHNAIDAGRASLKGVDKSVGVKHTLAVIMAVVIVVGSLPYAIGIVGAVDLATVDDFEDGDTNIETSGYSGWSGSIGSGNFVVVDDDPLEGSFSGKINQTDNNVGDEVTISRDAGDFQYDRFQFLLNITTIDSSESTLMVYIDLQDSSSGVLAQMSVGGSGAVYTNNGTDRNTTGSFIDEGKTYNVTMHNFDYSANTFDLKITRVSDGTVAVDVTGRDFTSGTTGFDTIRFGITDTDPGTTEYKFDSVSVDDPDLLHTVSGTVKDTAGDPIDNATVTINSTSDELTTNSSGYYEVNLSDGTYELTANKTNFEPNSTTVTVSGADVNNTNITLSSQVDLRLEVPTFMWQNSTASYTVWDDSGDNSVDVTDNATVTSSDPANLTVHENNNTLESTSDLSFNGEITITATYDGSSVSKNVTVANKTVENLDKMGNMWDMVPALWGNVPHPDTGERPGGTQQTMLLMFIALAAAIIVSRNSTSFGGFGAFVMVMVMGWFLGYVSDGLAMITVFTSLFIGLNLAANIDYSVRK